MLNGAPWPRPRGWWLSPQGRGSPRLPPPRLLDTRAVELGDLAASPPHARGGDRHGVEDGARVVAWPGDVAGRTSGAGCFLTAFSPGRVPRPHSVTRKGHSGAELWPPNSYVEAPTVGTSECGLIWRQGLYRGHEGKLRTLGQALIRQDCCPYTKRRSGHRHAGGRPCVAIRRRPPHTGEGGLGRSQPCALLDLGLPASRTRRPGFWCLSPAGLRHFMVAA